MFKFTAKVYHDTVDSITSDFTAMVAKLEDLAERKLKAAEAALAQILHLQSAADLAKAEAEKARAVVTNINNIFTTKAN